MRMWMINPAALCNQHLLGEHVECHMFLGTIKRNISLEGYVDNNLLQLSSLVDRHNDLAAEMTRRGMNHKSPITEEEFLSALNNLKASNRVLCSKVDVKSSLKDLMNRCSACRANAVLTAIVNLEK